MKIKLILICTFLIMTTFSFAADQVNVVGYTPFAREKLTVTTTAVSQLYADYTAIAGAVFITVETNTIRYWIDGGIPNATTGHPVVPAAYQNLWFNDPMSIKEFRAIAVGGNATLNITYYRRN